MPSLNWRLEKLTDAPAKARCDLLLAALAHCEPDETEPIARASLACQSPAAVVAVIRLLDRHPSLYDDLLRMDRPALVAGMQLVFISGFSRSAALAIELTRRVNDPGVSLALLAPLQSDHEALRAAAATAILELTLSMAGETGRRRMAAAGAHALDMLVCGAMECYEAHRRFEIILAASLLHRRIHTKLRAMLHVPATPQRLAVQGVPRQTGDRLVRANLINWLDSDLLGRQSAYYLDTLDGLDSFADALSGAHLLLTPARRKAMAHADRAARRLPAVGDAVNLPIEAQASLPRYVSALPMSANRQVSCLSDLIALPSPMARWRAAELLMSHRSDEARDAVRCFARDGEAAAAAGPAAHLLNDINMLSTAELRALRRCSHPAMAARAMQELASRNAEQWVEFAKQMPRHALLAAAHRLHNSQKSALKSELAKMYHGPERDLSLTAILVTRRLRLTQELEAALLGLLQSNDAQRCSAAASALGDFMTPARLVVLKRLLRHDHARVRANAVEAIGQAATALEPDQRAATIVEVIAPHAGSRHNRERANALAAWIRNGDRAVHPGESNTAVEIDITPAVDHLRSMLRDPDPLHRVSAIWAAARTRRPEVVGNLKELVQTERLEPVRSRAMAALRRVRPVKLTV